MADLRVGVRNTVRKSGNLCRKKWIFEFRQFKTIARFSKYDFWIPGKISRRHRYSEKFRHIFFETKFLYKNIRSLTTFGFI